MGIHSRRALVGGVVLIALASTALAWPGRRRARAFPRPPARLADRVQRARTALAVRPGAVDASEFAPDRVIQVAIKMDAADWDTLRTQARSVPRLFTGDCLGPRPPSPYTWFDARVIVDGTRFDHVRIKKKGFIGSGSITKPSLRLKIDGSRDRSEAAHSELHELVLDNSLQDPAYVRQCLAYRVFTAAGVPAPRCNFAHVVIDGEDLGLYVSVENVDERFVARRFGAPGALYQGSLADFEPRFVGMFERQGSAAPADDGPAALAAALAAPDALLLDRLAPLVDVDAFLTFWAVESLLRDWDGYSGESNNFYAYRDPRTGRFQLIPSGADMALGGLNGKEAIGGAYRTGALAWRLDRIPAVHARYVARLRAVLASSWNEADLLAEVDRMQRLITPFADPGARYGLAEGLGDIRAFIRGRRAALTAALATPAPDEPPRDSWCIPDFGRVHGAFATTWRAVPPSDPFAAAAGPDDAAHVRITQSLTMADGARARIVLSIARERFAIGTFDDDWNLVNGVLLRTDPVTGVEAKIAQLGAGTVTLSAAGTSEGEAVVGSYDATLTHLPGEGP